MIISYKGEDIQFAVEIKKNDCPDESLPPEVIAIVEERYRNFFQSLLYAGLGAVYSGALFESFEKDFRLLVEKHRSLLQKEMRNDTS